jgi:hypothetical protein
MRGNENDADSKPRQLAFWGHRQQVAALVATHLCGTFLAAYSSQRLEYIPVPDGVPSAIAPWIVAGLYGFQIGQILLLVSWGAFAGQPWFLRLPRFLALTAWMLLLSSLGDGLLLGWFSTSVMEEQSALTLIQMVSPVVVLFSFGFFSRRRFTSGNSEKGKKIWQFSIRRLMLITTELALLFALGKIVLDKRFVGGEFWIALNLRFYLTQELIPLAVSVTTLPIVFVGLSSRRHWLLRLALVLYLLLCSLLTAWMQLAALLNNYNPHSFVDWWPELGRMFCDYLVTHLSAAATILITFWILRRIGYDFRRREEEPLPSGRSSSNARNSAASASA